MARPPLDVEAVLIGLNEEERISQCIHSVRDAWARVSTKPICITYVDSGSTDRSTEIAATMADRVLVIKSLPSAAAGRTAGIREASCEWILFLDSDMQLDGEWFESIARRHDVLADACVGGITGMRADFVTDESTGIVSKRENVYRVATERLATHIGGALMARRTALNKVGGYRCDLLTGEEPELLARLLNAGFHIVELPTPFISHFIDRPIHAVDHLRKWTSRQGKPRRSFARAFLYAAKGGYLRPFIRIYFLPTVVWIAHTITLLLLASGFWAAAALAQVGLIALLVSRRRSAEWFLAVVRIAGIIEELIGHAKNRDVDPSFESLRYAHADPEAIQSNEN